MEKNETAACGGKSLGELGAGHCAGIHERGKATSVSLDIILLTVSTISFIILISP